jgi:methyl-accepting chemotaxis protein
MSFISRFASLRIRGRLIAGFAAVCVVLAAAVGYTVLTVGGVSQTVDRMVTLRTPVALDSTEMVGNLYSTLATLRGYLLTGNPQGKADRAAMWKELDTTAAKIDVMVERFTNPENKRKWADAKALLVEFRAAQDKAEAIAFTPDAFPATKLLDTEAAPRVQTMFSELTKMINEEATLEATPERKSLLKAMADARGNVAAGAAQIRLFLLTGEKGDKDKYAGPRENYERAFAALNAQKALMSPTQKTSFDAISKAHTEFGPLPEKLFALRDSKQWNMPVYILVTEAAPRALKLLDLLDGPKGADGTRSGGVKTNQTMMLTQEAGEVRNGMSFLAMVQWALLAGGLLAGAVIAFITARSIATPIQRMTAAMGQLAHGDTSVAVPSVGRRDEIGDMAGAVQVFKDNMIEAERLRAEQAETERRMAAQRKADMRQLANDFQSAVGDIIETVSSAST